MPRTPPAKNFFSGSVIPSLMLILTVVIAGLLLFCLLRPEATAGHGVTHPTFSQMNQGGGASRHDNLIVIGGLYGGLQIVLLVAGLGLGVRRDRSGLIPLVLAGAAYLAVFAAMVGTYAADIDDAPTVLGLPLPTALLVFAMPSVPCLFILLYIVKFRQWIYNDEDAQRFAALLTQSRQDKSRGSRADG